jgi:hypothetical protein
MYFIDSLVGWITGENGVVMKTTNGGITFVSEEQKKISSDFLLFNNYPNPFNLVTVIRYQLSVNSVVTLKVYNVLGQEVATLIHSRLMDKGKYEIEFDGSKLSSGIYYYRIDVTQNDNSRYSETKKLVLLK